MSVSDLFFQQHVEKGSSIVHYGCGDQNLKNMIETSEYCGVDILDGSGVQCDLNQEFPDFEDKQYDFALVGGIMEHLDDPVEFLRKVRLTAKKTIILEYKYDLYGTKDNWKEHWKNRGLEWELQWLWDHVHNTFYFDDLDEEYAGKVAIHTCQMPTTKEFEKIVNEGPV
jgi:hypothetical protein